MLQQNLKLNDLYRRAPKSKDGSLKMGSPVTREFLLEFAKLAQETMQRDRITITLKDFLDEQQRSQESVDSMD